MPIFINASPFLAGSLIKSAPKKRPQRRGGRALGPSCSAVLGNREGGRGGELSLIKPAHAGSATVVRIEHPWKFSTASDLF